MGKVLHFEGIDTLKISNKIELPDIPELLRNPMFVRADAEDIYKHGGEFNRWLLSQVPISNGKKHVAVTIDFKLLTPQWMPMQTSNWHCDGSERVCPYYCDDELFHIMIGHTDLTTDFIKYPVDWHLDDGIDIEDYDHLNFRLYLESQVHKIHNFAPISMESNKIVTFNSRHVHRAPNPPKKSTFRFSIIVRESNFDQSRPIDHARIPTSHVWDVAQDKSLRNIEQGERGIILRNLFPEGRGNK